MPLSKPYQCPCQSLFNAATPGDCQGDGGPQGLAKVIEGGSGYCRGLYSYGLMSYGLYNYGLYNYGLCNYGGPGYCRGGNSRSLATACTDP